MRDRKGVAVESGIFRVCSPVGEVRVACSTMLNRGGDDGPKEMSCHLQERLRDGEERYRLTSGCSRLGRMNECGAAQVKLIVSSLRVSARDDDGNDCVSVGVRFE